MEISLPPAKWHRCIGRIQGTGTSGYDWLDKGATTTGDTQWLRGTVKTDPGDLFLSYAVGVNSMTEAQRPTILWMAVPIRGNLLYLAETSSDKSWYMKLCGLAKTLLGMSTKARILFGLDRRLEELRASRDRGDIAMSAITEVNTTRQRYLEQLALPMGGNATPPYIIAAFENFLIEQVSYLNKSKTALLAELQTHYKQLESANVKLPSRIQGAPPKAGRRNLQLRPRIQVNDEDS